MHPLLQSLEARHEAQCELCRRPARRSLRTLLAALRRRLPARRA